MERLSLLLSPFMLKAVATQLMAAATLSWLGVVVMVFGLNAVRFALMHLGLLGASLGLAVGADPLFAGLGTITGGSFLFGPAARRMRLEVGMVGAFFMTGSLAAAFLMLYKAGIPAMDAFSIFTGSILMVTGRDILATVGLGLVVVFVMTRWYWEINLVLFDRELAAALGVKAALFEQVLLVLLGLAVGIAIKLVGALMVDAVVLLPAMTALPLARSLRGALVLTSVFGVTAGIIGILAAVVWDLPISASVAGAGVIVFLLVQAARFIIGRAVGSRLSEKRLNHA